MAPALKEDYAGRTWWPTSRACTSGCERKRYRHQPILRVHDSQGQRQDAATGHFGILEDKIVQDALREVLQAVYEQDFLDCSHGFRPGRSAHDAIRAVHRAADRGELNWVLEADIMSFFDSVDRKALVEMLRERVADGSLLRLVSKCLHVGVLDGEEFSRPDVGTAQGSILSPLLGNIYLHHVLDLWFARVVQPRLRGRACLIRYADDFVIGFQYQDDAERVRAVLPKRMQRYGLTLHPDKTRLLDFRRPLAARGGKASGLLRLLGVHAVLAALPCKWSLAAGVQDSACAPGTGHPDRLRLVPEPPAPGSRRCSICRASQSLTGPLQQLRG